MTITIWIWTKYMKIQWKLIIDQKFRVVFQISWPTNIPQKWFSTQNEPLDVRFLNQTDPKPWELSIFVKSNRNHGATIKSVFKRMHHGFCLISPEIRGLHGWGLSYLGPDIHRSVLSTEPFWGIFASRDIWKQLWTSGEWLILNVFLNI